MADLGPADLELAFTFSRSTAAPYRDSAGTQQLAPVNVPRFDHDAQGTALGLLIGRGGDAGEEDRLAIDPLMLPVDLVESTDPVRRQATVFHRWLPEGATIERFDAWYTRDAAAAIDALGRQVGHHRAFGVTAGFTLARDGEVRLRTRAWRVAGYLLASPGRVLTDGVAQPLIVAGVQPQT